MRARLRSSNCPSSISLCCQNSGRASPFRRGSGTFVLELILLGLPCDVKRAVNLGWVTQVVADQDLLKTATEVAQKLAAKPAGALQASKKLMKRSFREQIKTAMKVENEEFSVQVRSDDAKEALTAFLEKRPPNFNETASKATELHG